MRTKISERFKRLKKALQVKMKSSTLSRKVGKFKVGFR